ncbi:hypothetical protein [Neobacillus vireti]|uniref:hypothetical protein n=1 Tax=Neobacillus vireti TaxID=220686 RepID=UPI002FFEAD36
MKLLSHFTTFIILCILVALVAYLDSPYSFIHSGYSYSTSEPAVAQPVEIKPSTEIPVLENRLDSVEKMDGYYVEIYQEYEVFYDGEGNVAKKNQLARRKVSGIGMKVKKSNGKSCRKHFDSYFVFIAIL